MAFFVFVRVILCGFYFWFMRICAVLCSFVRFCSDNVWTMFGQCSDNHLTPGFLLWGCGAGNLIFLFHF